MKKLLNIVAGIFKSDKGKSIIESGMEYTAEKTKWKLIFKLSIVAILALLAILGTLSSEEILKLLEDLI